MDSRTIAKTLKYNPSKHQQQPIFGSLFVDQTTLEDLSSSSYVKPEDNDHDAEIGVFDAQKYFGENNDAKYTSPQQNKNSLLTQEPLPRLSLASSADDGYWKKDLIRTRSFHATPTASSEASWNSQTGLLVNPPGSVKVSFSSRDHVINKSSSHGNNNHNRKWIFGRKCCCTGKKSVRVKEATTSSASVHHLGPTSPPPPTPTTSHNNNTNKKKSTIMSQRSSSTSHNILPPNPLVLSPPDMSDPPRQQRISATGGFSFPILKNPAAQVAVRPPSGFKGMITKANVNPLDDDPPRDSLEVYQPTENIIASTRHHHFNPGSPIARMETTDDDLGSDASSDLFELDSFSTQTSLYPMYRRRDSLDEAHTFNGIRFNNNNNNNNNNIRRELPPPSVVATTECYAPSEVSIDWSVTTAEGYDRASLSNISVSASETGDDWKRKENRRGGLLLMSCRHGKAVSVGPQPVKCSPAPEGGGGEKVYGKHVGGKPSKKTTRGNARLSLAFAA